MMNFSILVLSLVLIWGSNAVPVEKKEAVEAADSANMLDWEVPVEAYNFDAINDRLIEADELNDKYLEDKSEAVHSEESQAELMEHDFNKAQGPPLEQDDKPELHTFPGLSELSQNMSGYSHFEVEEAEHKEADNGNRDMHFEDFAPEDFDWSKPNINVPEHHEDYQPHFNLPYADSLVLDSSDLFPVDESNRKSAATQTTDAKSESVVV